MSTSMKVALWALAGMAVVTLGAITVHQASERAFLNRSQVTAVLENASMFVSLREHPSLTASINAMVERGTEVVVLGVEDEGGRTWFLVACSEAEGWLPGEQVRASTPPLDG